MEKIIKALFESSFIFNNKYYVFTCTRDLIEKTNLTGSTIRANIRKLIDLNILIETGYSNTYGLVPYHAST